MVDLSMQRKYDETLARARDEIEEIPAPDALSSGESAEGTAAVDKEDEDLTDKQNKSFVYLY